LTLIELHRSTYLSLAGESGSGPSPWPKAGSPYGFWPEPGLATRLNQLLPASVAQISKPVRRLEPPRLLA
jgi:hypothetical protein